MHKNRFNNDLYSICWADNIPTTLLVAEVSTVIVTITHVLVQLTKAIVTSEFVSCTLSSRAAYFIAPITAVVPIIALPLGINALTVCTLELSWCAGLRRTTYFITPITAVNLTVTSPFLVDAETVIALELVVITFSLSYTKRDIIINIQGQATNCPLKTRA